MLRPHPSPMMMAGGIPFTVAASPASAAVTRPYDGTTEVTNSVTVSQVTGPASSLTFAWSHVSGNSAIVIASPSAATTTFSATPAENTSTTAVKRCTVTNGFGQIATVDVNVTITAQPSVLTVSVAISGPSPFNIPAGQDYVASVSVSATGGDGGPYSFSSIIRGGNSSSLSPTTGPSMTMTVAGQAAGTNAFATVATHATDGSGHSGDGNGTVFLSWS